jgi:hypothetical protein
MKNKLFGITIASIIFLSSAPAWADWQPVLTPGQSVYIDPALVNHVASPIKFQADLEKQIDELQAKSGINYYVWAIETSDTPQKGKSLGVQKTDEAIAAWSGLSAFPRDNYTLIVWARRADNPAKGGMGINVSNGLKKPDVPAILKEYMPRNPQGAVMAIARDVAETKAVNAFLGKAGSVALLLLGISILGVLLLLCWQVAVDTLKPNFAYKTKSEESIGSWKTATSNAASIYQELTDDKTIEFYTALEKEGELADFLKKTNIAANRFLCFYQTAIEALNGAVESQKLGNYKTAYLKLVGVHTVNFGKLPLEKASIFGGLDDTETFDGDCFLASLDNATKEALKCWSILKLSVNTENPSAFLKQYFAQKEKERKEQEKRELQYRVWAAALKAKKRDSAARLTKTEREIPLLNKVAGGSSSTINNNTVYVDNSSHSSSWGSSSGSSPSSDSNISSSSDWGSSGSDYSSSDSSGGDY